MTNYTLESFITFCDDMMIAEESAKDMTDIISKTNSQINDIKEKIKKVDLIDNIKKLLLDEKNILENAKRDISSTKYSMSDYIKGHSKIIQSIIVAIPLIAGAIHGNKALQRKTLDKKDIGITTALIGTGVGAGLAGNQIRKGIDEDILKTKKRLIAEIDRNLFLNKVSENVFTKIKSMGFKNLSDFRKERYNVKIDDNGNVNIVKMIGFD